MSVGVCVRTEDSREHLSRTMTDKRTMSEVDKTNLSVRMLGNTYGKANKGKPKSEEHRRHIGQAKLGKHPSEAARANMHRKHKPMSEEQKAKMIGSTYAKGYKHSDIQRANNLGNIYGKANKGKSTWSKGLTKESDERVKKRAEKLIGKSHSKHRKRSPCSEETKEKIKNTLVTHHYDFIHENDFLNNKRERTRQHHNKIHRQSGIRGAIFVKNAWEKGLVTRSFYEDYLTFINQDEIEEIDT